MHACCKIHILYIRVAYCAQFLEGGAGPAPAHCTKHVKTVKPQLNTQSVNCGPTPDVAQEVAHSVPVAVQAATHVGKSATETWLVELKREFVESSAMATAAKSTMARVTIVIEATYFPMIDW